MADKQISDLTSASALTDGSLFVLEQAGAAMKANWGMMKNYISPGVAAQYSTSATYDVGDYVIYNGQLYRCTTAITTAETWTAAHWTAAVLCDDFVELKEDLLYREISSFKQGLFERGSLLSGHDDNYHENTRIRSVILYAQNDLKIESKVSDYPDAQFSVHKLDERGNFVSATNWTKDYTISKGTIFRVLLSIDSSATEYTVAQIYSAFSFYSVNCGFKKFTENENLTFLFEHGGMSYGEDDPYASSARLRMINKTICDKDILVKCNGGYYVLVYFDSEGVYSDGWGWLQGNRIIPANTPFRLLITSNNTTTNYIPTQTILDCFELQVIDKYEPGLNPNIIFQCRNVDDSAYPPYSKWYVQAAYKNQYDRVRVVVRETTDGHFVLIHDNTINNEARNLDGTAISGTVYSDGHTLAELNGYDWGIKYGNVYAGASVPTLDNACKFAALYNLGLTIEAYITYSETNINAIVSMLAKYGLIENFILIASGVVSTSQINLIQSWIDKCEYISPVFGGSYSVLSQYESEINALKTSKNKIYCVGIDTWGTEEVTEQTRNLIVKNGWSLYSSNAMNKNQLFNQVGFDKGYTLIEANNIYMIKDTVIDYANEQL